MRVPPSELDKRLAALDSAYKLLRDVFEPTIDQGSKLLNTWPDLLQTGGPLKLRDELKKYQLEAAKAEQAFGNIQGQYEYYRDIQDLMEPTYQKAFSEGLQSARQAAEKLPDPLAGDYKFLYQPYADRFREGIAAWGQWTQAKKQEIIAQRNDYLSRVQR